jgi:hypothetical protein
MVKLEDPTVPYADVIPRWRRERSATAADVFRLGAPGYDWRATYAGPGTCVVIAASDSALSSAEDEDTVKVIGTVGGLLADLGFQVYAARAMTGGDLRPSLVIWVGGTATSADERTAISALDAPGVSVAACPVNLPGWRHIDAEEVGDWRTFAKRFVAEVAGLVDVPEQAFVSNAVSNEPRRTGPDDAGRGPGETGADLHEHGRSRTRQHRRDPGTAGS